MTDSPAIFDLVLGPLPEVASALERVYSAAQRAVDENLFDICRLRIAMILQCDEELSHLSEGTGDPILSDIRSWPTSQRFSPRDRACLALAEQFVIDVKNLDDQTVNEVREYLGVEGLVNFISALLVIEQRQRLLLAWNALFVGQEGR